MSNTIKAQFADKTTHNAMNDSLIAYYNKQAFAESYTFMSTNMKAHISESQWVGLLKNNLYVALGEVLRSEYLEATGGGGHQYKWIFDKSALQVTITVSKSQQIEGIFFKPYIEKPKNRTVAAATDNPLKTNMDRKVDSVVQTYIQSAATAGVSIGIIKDGQVHTYHYGETDKNKPKLPDNNTIYEIGSITKTFTGILLAKAVLAKKIKLDDDIRLHLPEKYPNLAFKEQPILIKHLANHTSRIPGFPVAEITTKEGYNPDNPYKHYTSDMALAYLPEIKLDTAAGIKSEYSNFATGLMGIILEKKYGMLYEDLLKKYITDPLSMNDTKINLTKAEYARFAKPYDEAGNPSAYWDITGLGAAGAIRSTLTDMLKYAQANMSKPNKAMRLAQKATFKDKPNQQIGLYWQLTTDKKEQLITWHNGGTGGFRTFCGFISSKNIAVVILSNSGVDVTQKGFDLLNVVAR
jgi:CubicO group peptidase (beta-lactamase class C family)